MLYFSILWWLGKDVAWNAHVQLMWIIFMIPAMLISWDFTLQSALKEVSEVKRLFIAFSY